MTPILQAALPQDMQTARDLPGVQPVIGSWARCDEAYGAQMAYRRHLVQSRRAEVLHDPPATQAAIQELWDHLIPLLPSLGFRQQTGHIRCPDGVDIALGSDSPLALLGQMLQCDLCLLTKEHGEHVLKAAVVCFPASWTLAEKIDRPLSTIHAPVDSYDPAIAARVQRLFDGVRAHRPLWRFNQLWYADPDLFQPRPDTSPRAEPCPDAAAYFRAERQVILRLPETGWVLFAIHTYVLEAKNAPGGGGVGTDR